MLCHEKEEKNEFEMQQRLEEFKKNASQIIDYLLEKTKTGYIDWDETSNETDKRKFTSNLIERIKSVYFFVIETVYDEFLNKSHTTLVMYCKVYKQKIKIHLATNDEKVKQIITIITTTKYPYISVNKSSILKEFLEVFKHGGDKHV